MTWSAEAASNWFLTWDSDSPSEGKSFLLQIEISNLTYRDLLSDGINSYVTICRQRNGPSSGWELIGKTGVLKDETRPAYPEGIRIFYEQGTNLSEDLLKVICYHRREGLKSEEMIGSACISVRELVRAFGTRVQVELVRTKRERVVGWVWFLGEGLPEVSPRGGGRVLEFRVGVRAPGRMAEVKWGVGCRLFVVIWRERGDKTWGVVGRSGMVRRGIGGGLFGGVGRVVFPVMRVRQSEICLGEGVMRRMKVGVYMKGKGGGDSVCVGEVETSVDEVVNEFGVDTSLDVRVDGKVVGEFVRVRGGEGTAGEVRVAVEVNYFEREKELRDIEERRRRKRVHLDSP